MADEYRIIKYGNYTFVIENDKEYPFINEDSYRRRNLRINGKIVSIEGYIENNCSSKSIDECAFLSNDYEKDEYGMDNLDEIRNMIKEIGIFTENQIEILSRYLLGETISEIAKHMNKTKQYVSRSMTKYIIPKLKEWYQNSKNSIDWYDVYIEEIKTKTIIAEYGNACRK